MMIVIIQMCHHCHSFEAILEALGPDIHERCVGQRPVYDAFCAPAFFCSVAFFSSAAFSAHVPLKASHLTFSSS